MWWVSVYKIELPLWEAGCFPVTDKASMHIQLISNSPLPVMGKLGLRLQAIFHTPKSTEQC